MNFLDKHAGVIVPVYAFTILFTSLFIAEFFSPYAAFGIMFLAIIGTLMLYSIFTNLPKKNNDKSSK